MNSIIVLNQTINSTNHSTHHIRIVKSKNVCRFELLKANELLIGMYFSYGEKIHKAACCLGGAIYGFCQDDELAEDVMAIIEANKDVLGGYELSR